MVFDYKKEYKEFYIPKAKPTIVSIPKMNYIAVRGLGDPNDEDGDYKAAIRLLYAIAFTIKLSKKGNHRIDGYFDYVVPPLEGMMHEFIEQQGYEPDITDKRLHHEIYLSDARKVAPEKLKTVIRHPIREKQT